MGTSNSKANAETAGIKPDSEEIASCDDPRSPTSEIMRTPLQGKNGSKHNITKNVDLRKTLEGTAGEEKLINNNPILSAVIKNHLQLYDPRSPSQDIDRTPIIISRQIDDDPLTNDFGSPRLENDCYVEVNATDKPVSEMVVPRNLCDGFFDLTLDDTLKQSDEPICSSTLSNDKTTLDDSDNTPKKLLETNFDYIEPEIITNEISTKDDSKHVNGTAIKEKMWSHYKVLNSDPRSPSCGIDRTPIVIANNDISDENVEEMSDDTLIKVLQNKNTELREAVKSSTNRNDGLLIYEDEVTGKINETPKKAKSSECNGSRTPLSCMKNKSDSSHIRSKSANMDLECKNEKGPKRVSHIPRLKALSKQPVVIHKSNGSLKSLSKNPPISGDCENTPPHSHRDLWDKELSIIL